MNAQSDFAVAIDNVGGHSASGTADIYADPVAGHFIACNHCCLVNGDAGAVGDNEVVGHDAVCDLDSRGGIELNGVASHDSDGDKYPSSVGGNPQSLDCSAQVDCSGKVEISPFRTTVRA
jgi:hypothetical protein